MVRFKYVSFSPCPGLLPTFTSLSERFRPRALRCGRAREVSLAGEEGSHDVPDRVWGPRRGEKASVREADVESGLSGVSVAWGTAVPRREL